MMVILGYKTGQLGNRLFVYSHWMANAMAYGYKIYNPSFDEYEKYFENISENVIDGYPKGKKLFGLVVFRKICLFISKIMFKLMYLLRKNKIGNRIIRYYVLNEGEICDLSEKGMDLRKGTKCLVVQGWLFRDDENLVRYKGKIVKHFCIKARYAKNVKQLISSIRKDGSILIGLHMRGGDYKDYMEGKYYYSENDYRKIIKKVEIHFGGMEKVRWLICSNDSVPRDFLAANMFLGNNQIVEDMYAFAACDYIVGPPSTYTAWASFYGDVPLWVVHNIADDVNFERIQA